MNKQAEILNNASGVLFIVGFFTSRIKSIPIFLLGTVFSITSLIAYLVGYASWYAASLFYPNHPRKQEHWFGFAPFKNQYQIAALVGAVATIMCIVAPVFFILAAWLYAISNLVWAISECHRKENPFPSDKLYSTARQGHYLRYAILATANSLQTALSATIIAIFPPATIVVIASSLIIGFVLALPTIYYWMKFMFGKFRPDSVNHSYAKVSDKLPSLSKPKDEHSHQNARDLRHKKPDLKKSHSKFEIDAPEDSTYSSFTC